MLEQKIWVRTKVLETLLKKFKDSLASSQVWSDLFAFPLGTHRRVRNWNWAATTVRATHCPPVRWGRSAGGTRSLQRPGQQPCQVLFWVKGPAASPHFHINPVLISPQGNQHHSEGERQWEERWEAKCHHFSPLVMVGGPAPAQRHQAYVLGLVFLVQVLGDLSFAKNLSSNPVVCS